MNAFTSVLFCSMRHERSFLTAYDIASPRLLRQAEASASAAPNLTESRCPARAKSIDASAAFSSLNTAIMRCTNAAWFGLVGSFASFNNNLFSRF